MGASFQIFLEFVNDIRWLIMFNEMIYEQSIC